MDKQLPFAEVIEAADRLTIEEQEVLLLVLHGRAIDRRRSELAKEIEEAKSEFRSGSCSPLTPAQLIEEMLS